MSLLKIHRLLIGSGIAVCLFYTLRQGVDYASSSDHGALWRTVVSLCVAVVLGVYLRSIRPR